MSLTVLGREVSVYVADGLYWAGLVHGNLKSSGSTILDALQNLKRLIESNV